MRPKDDNMQSEGLGKWEQSRKHEGVLGRTSAIALGPKLESSSRQKVEAWSRLTSRESWQDSGRWASPSQTARSSKDRVRRLCRAQMTTLKTIPQLLVLAGSSDDESGRNGRVGVRPDTRFGVNLGGDHPLSITEPRPTSSLRS